MTKKKILIVDDEEGFTTMLGLNLEATGEYDVLAENDSTKAVKVALQYKPDLILLDIIMPRLEGPDVALRIRKNNFLTNTPIIFLTATIRESEVNSTGGRIGNNVFVAKPSNLTTLTESIEETIFSN